MNKENIIEVLEDFIDYLKEKEDEGETDKGETSKGETNKGETDEVISDSDDFDKVIDKISKGV